MSDNTAKKESGQSRPFTDNEFANRLNRVRAVMSEKEVDAVLGGSCVCQLFVSFSKTLIAR